MDLLHITSGTGWFAINGKKLPKGQFVITKSGRTLIIAHSSGQEQVRGSFEDFRDSEGNPFDSINDLVEHFDGIAFNIGGGDGNGVTNIVLTQEEFDAITPDPDTTYDIIEA